MPVARFLRLLLTLFVLVSGLLSVLGWSTSSGGWERVRLAADVGDVAPSAGSGTVRPATRGRAGLFSLISRALTAEGDTGGGPDAEFEMGDDRDLADDDGPQGFVAAASSDLWTLRLSAPYLEPNLWGIQPSVGHPRGHDEPPRI